MGRYIVKKDFVHRLIVRNRLRERTPEAMGRKLLNVIVYAKGCRIGDKLVMDDLADKSEIGDWMMPEFKMACTYAASQGWLIIEGDALMLTVAGSAAA